MIPVYLYQGVYIYTMLLLSVVTCLYVRNSGYGSLSAESGFSMGGWGALALCLVTAVWLGMRPVNGFYFGDTSNYAHTYELMQMSLSGAEDHSSEWVWESLMSYCSGMMDVSGFFTIVSLGYFGCTFWACRRLMPNGVWVAVLFNLIAFSFYSYGTNGIRNGLACSMMLVVLSYARGNSASKVMAGAVAFLMINIHRSTMLPLLMMLVSMTCVKSFRNAYVFWLLSIAISLVAGNTVAGFFAGLGFDERLSYITDEQDQGLFSGSGFRWDFLVYSMMPIVFGYYIIIRRGIRDGLYEMLLNTYTLTNAFWVMVIRANYSNRFAYLSWFMYPVVLAYPLLRMNIWEEGQGSRLSQIMLAHAAFTWLMLIIFT